MHELFREATNRAAETLDDNSRRDDRSYLLEADLDRAFVAALRSLTEGPVLARRQRHVPGWDPQPGQIDVLVEDDSGEDGRLRYAAELKWCNENKVFEGLWDIIKMTSMTEVPSVEAAYLVCGAPERYWDKPVECARELFFEPPADQPGTGVPDLIKTYDRWWVKYILGDSRGRFPQAPKWTRIDVVAAAQLTVAGQQWTLRTVSVSPSGTQTVPFEDGVPHH